MFLIEALGINNREQIIGYGSLPNGQLLGYLLTPRGTGGGNPRCGFSRMTAAIRATANPPTQNGTEARHATGTPMFPDPQFAWVRRQDKVRQGISWWRAAVTDQWAPRPGQEAEQADSLTDRYADLAAAPLLTLIFHGSFGACREDEQGWTVPSQPGSLDDFPLKRPSSTQHSDRRRAAPLAATSSPDIGCPSDLDRT